MNFCEYSKNFSGVFTALATTFDNENEEINFSEIISLINYQIENNIGGILLLGSTAETQSLTDEEKIKLLDFALDEINKRVPVMIGLNYNGTNNAIKIAEKFLAIIKKHNYTKDNLAFLVNNPSYNKPSEDGIFLHFQKIHDEIAPYPMIIYNIPSRSIIDLKNHFLKRLFLNLENIIGIKDCSGDPYRIFELSEWVNKSLKRKVSLFCGDDGLFLNNLINGGCGLISVCSNLYPSEMQEIYNYFRSKNYEESIELNKRFIPMFNALFVESNPSPLKYLMSLKFGTQNFLRPPLIPVSQNSEILLKDVFNRIENQ